MYIHIYIYIYTHIILYYIISLLVSDGKGAPDPNPRNLVNWCF